jgi:hypothetical protein
MLSVTMLNVVMPNVGASDIIEQKFDSFTKEVLRRGEGSVHLTSLY